MDKRYIVEFYLAANEEVVTKAGGIVRHNFTSIPEKLSAILSEEALTLLQEDPDIKNITEVKSGSGNAQAKSWGFDYTSSNRYRGSYRGDGVKVAIIDSGMYLHSDLPTPVAFCDYINGNTTSYDDNGHGTMVAGVIAAKDNTDGVVGIAPMVDLYICKVIDSTSRGISDDFAAGIEWAISQDVDIINFSISMDSFDIMDPGNIVVMQACQAAYNAGIIVVASSGNGTINDNVAVSQLCIPAVYNYCIGVGAITSTGTRASYSNYGSGLDCVAPGTNTYSTYNNGSTATLSGTSFSTAYVSGHLACLKEKYPSYTRAELVSKLLSLCDGSGNTTEYGDGCVIAEEPSITTPLSSPLYNGCTWSISGLSNAWNTTNYISCCLCTDSNHPKGSSSDPSGILDSHNAPSSGSAYNTPDFSFTSSSLSAVRKYDLYSYVKAANGLWYPCSYSYLVTAFATPSFNTFSRSGNLISIYFNGVPYADRYFIQCYKDGVYSSDASYLPGPDTAFTGLTPGSLYKFRCYCYDVDGVYPNSAYSAFSPEILPGFSWGKLYSPNDEFNISATKWNEFLECIRDTYSWKGWTLPRTLTNISSGHNLTALEFNNARFCIGSLNPTNIADKTAYSGSGEPRDSDLVKGADFNVLAQKLNGIM